MGQRDGRDAAGDPAVAGSEPKAAPVWIIPPDATPVEYQRRVVELLNQIMAVPESEINGTHEPSNADAYRCVPALPVIRVQRGAARAGLRDQRGLEVFTR